MKFLLSRILRVKRVIIFISFFVNVALADPFHRPHIPFPKNDEARKASFPFISGDTFRKISDHIFDETNVPFIPTRIQFADIVFVNGDMINEFFTYAYPLIAKPFILVTHNTDHSIPAHNASYLDHNKILAWFSQNIDREHAKLFGLPIGLANYHWPHGKIEIVISALQTKKSWNEREDKAYVNFLSKTNPAERVNVWNMFQNKPFCIVRQNRPYFEYLTDMQLGKFVISPPGNGRDCHRHWEALLMGAIPVVKHSPLDVLFEGLPVIFVNEWSEVTQEFLMQEYHKLQGRTFQVKKLYVEYWINHIRETQRKFRVA